jgi:hypothetical protein
MQTALRTQRTRVDQRQAGLEFQGEQIWLFDVPVTPAVADRGLCSIGWCPLNRSAPDIVGLSHQVFECSRGIDPVCGVPAGVLFS